MVWLRALAVRAGLAIRNPDGVVLVLLLATLVWLAEAAAAVSLLGGW